MVLPKILVLYYMALMADGPAAIQKGTRVLISLWDSLKFERVPKNERSSTGRLLLIGRGARDRRCGLDTLLAQAGTKQELLQRSTVCAAGAAAPTPVARTAPDILKRARRAQIILRAEPKALLRGSFFGRISGSISSLHGPQTCS